MPEGYFKYTMKARIPMHREFMIDFPEGSDEKRNEEAWQKLNQILEDYKKEGKSVYTPTFIEDCEDKVKALQEGVIRGAGLDVFEFGDYPLPELLELDNVVLTPHIGTQTMEVRVAMARAVSDNVIGFLEGDRPVARVLKP